MNPLRSLWSQRLCSSLVFHSVTGYLLSLTSIQYTVFTLFILKVKKLILTWIIYVSIYNGFIQILDQNWQFTVVARQQQIPDVNASCSINSKHFVSSLFAKTLCYKCKMATAWACTTCTNIRISFLHLCWHFHFLKSLLCFNDVYCLVFWLKNELHNYAWVFL